MLGRFMALGGLALAVVATACSSETNATDSSGGGGGAGNTSSAGASTQQVSGCKEGCNKMKFFGCNSAEEQATCYENCTSATPAQIELFTACAQTSICDPECRTNITPKPQPGQPPPASSPTASPSSCATACDKLVSCSFIPVGAKTECVSRCGKEAYQYQIDCVNNNACEAMKKACGDPTGGGSGGGTIDGDTCEAQCDSLLLFECISSTEQAACRSKCGSADAAKKNAFDGCMFTAGPDCGKANACYSTFKN